MVVHHLSRRGCRRRSKPRSRRSWKTPWPRSAASTSCGRCRATAISMLIITFNLNRDIDAAAQDVRDAVSQRAQPPAAATPIRRSSASRTSTASPIMSLARLGQSRQPRAVRAGRPVREERDRVGARRRPGVHRRRGRSGRAGQYRGPPAGGLPAVDHAGARGAGAAERRHSRRPRRRRRPRAEPAHAGPHATIPREFLDLVVASSRGTPVRLRDLGEVVDGSKEVRTLARLDGKPAVVLEVQRQSGANTVDVIDAVKERLDRCRELLPADVELSVIQDQSRYIHAAMHEIQKPPDRGQHPGHGRGAAVHALLALDADRRGGHSRLDHRHVRRDALPRLHAQQRHHAGPGADGGRGDRRRDRGAGKRVPLHRGKGDVADAGGHRGHARDRPGRAGHHAVAGDRVSAGVVPVERDRADALPVRHDERRWRSWSRCWSASR